MISLEKVNKSYGSNELKQEVLNDLSFDFKKGTTYSIVGPSGSGKTTFLNILSGLDVFDSGSIKIENVELSHLNQDELSKLRKDNFSFAYQFHYLLENLTIYENCLAANLDAQEHEIDQILSRLGINNLKHKFPSHISGGERQRASLARALVKKPKILLLDEPTGNLDEKNSLIVQNLLLEYAKDNGCLMIYVTHDLPFAEKADKILRIENKGLNI
mgnify:FL=1